MLDIVDAKGNSSGNGGIFQVTAPQARFIVGSTRRNQLFIGGRGAGKTAVLMLSLLVLAMTNDGCRHYACGRTYKDAGTQLFEYFMEWVAKYTAATGHDPVVSHDKSLQRLRLSNGAQVWFVGYDRVDKLRGKEAAVFAFDEIEFSAANPNYVWNVIGPGCRQPGAQVYRMMAATTPNGIGHIAGRFLRHQQAETDPRSDEDAMRRARTYFVTHATMYDNPWLSDEVKDEIEAGVSGRMRLQEVEGRILSSSDAVFSEWSNDRHVIAWEWHKDLPYVIAIDWGTSHAYHGVWQVVDRPGIRDKDGRPLAPGTWILAAEEKLEGTSYQEHLGRILEFVRKAGRKPKVCGADRAIPKQNSRLRAALGVPVLSNVDKNEQDVINGVEMLRFMLDPANEDAPRLVVSDQISQDVISEEGRGFVGSVVNYGYQRDRTTGLLTNRPLKDNLNDHPLDATRYILIPTRLHADLHGGAPCPFAWPEPLRMVG
jgi:hypothetical protein